MEPDGRTLVILHWSDYHNLHPYGRSTRGAARIPVDVDRNMDEYVYTSIPNAVADAFWNLCEAAWTPNQSLEQQIRNAEIIKRAYATLAEA